MVKTCWTPNLQNDPPINSWRIRSCFCSGAMFIRYNVSQDVISSAVFHGNIRNTRGAERMIFTLCWFCNTRPFFVVFVPVFLPIFVLFCDLLVALSGDAISFFRPCVSHITGRIRIGSYGYDCSCCYGHCYLRAAYAPMHADVLIKPQP